MVERRERAGGIDQAGLEFLAPGMMPAGVRRRHGPRGWAEEEGEEEAEDVEASPERVARRRENRDSALAAAAVAARERQQRAEGSWTGMDATEAYGILEAVGQQKGALHRWADPPTCLSA